jgi:hypothetical protein
VQVEHRTGGTGDAGNTYGAPGTAARVPAPPPPPPVAPPQPAYSPPPQRAYAPPPPPPPPAYSSGRPERWDRHRSEPYRPQTIYIESPPVQYVAPPVYADVVVEPARPVEPSYERPATESYRSSQSDLSNNRSRSADARQSSETYYVMVDGTPYPVPREKMRYVDDVAVLRPFGPWYNGYGGVKDDAAALRWLRLTGITLRNFHELTEEQLRKHEQAQIDATTAPVGLAVAWKQGAASGSVRAKRDFEGAGRNRCREFEHVVSVGKKTEKTVALACRDADGAWWPLRPS